MKSDSFRCKTWAFYWILASQKNFHGHDVMKKNSFGEFFITILVNINNVSLNSQDFDKKYFLQRQNKKKCFWKLTKNVKQKQYNLLLLCRFLNLLSVLRLFYAFENGFVWDECNDFLGWMLSKNNSTATLCGVVICQEDLMFQVETFKGVYDFNGFRWKKYNAKKLFVDL